VETARMRGIKAFCISLICMGIHLAVSCSAPETSSDRPMAHLVGNGFDFWIDRYEVTRGEYGQVMGVNNVPARLRECGEKCPVSGVDWYSADEYCRKVGKRLPSEREWEYAATSGGRSVEYATEDGTLSCSSATWGRSIDKECAGPGSPTPVGSYAPNPAGLYDMSGNVWEWTSGPSYASRGGSFLSAARFLRPTVRILIAPSFGYYDQGFRCAQ
jgi:formylglycine-generating enzyme required for sulfatase activity